MPDQIQSNNISLALKSISNLLNEDNIQGIIIGGLAASLLGRPRFTNDIDLMILDLDDRLAEFFRMIERFDIEPRIEDAEEFAKKTRVLLLRHTKSGINIDISMGMLPFEREAYERRTIQSAFGLDLSLPAPEDLIIFKSVSMRPQDVEDIRAIIARHPDIDRDRILSVVRDFADVLGNREIYIKIHELLD
jgi:hypothetical protein